MEPDNGGIKVRPRLRIDGGDLPLPSVTDGLAELADVPTVIAEMQWRAAAS